MIMNSKQDIVLDSNTSDDVINSYINKILDEGKNYGKSNYGDGKKINIEYGTLNVINTIYGDSLSRIISFMGYDVIREYFIKDNNIDVDKEKKVLDKMRVNFDVFTSQQLLYDNGIVDYVLGLIKRNDNCYINDGSLCLKTGNNGVILVNSDGSYTRLISDIAYYVDRIKRGYDVLVDIKKGDYGDYFNTIKLCIDTLGYDSKKVNFIVYDSDINDQLINEVGVNVLRYCLLSELDYKMASERMNYIDSVNVKMCKVLRQKTNNEIGTIDDDIAYTILNKLIRFERVVRKASMGCIDILCNYLYELASLFDKYYSEVKDLNNRLIEAIKIVMNNVADLIGLIFIEEM